MTYIDYLNEFNRWVENNHLTLPAQVLYFRMLNVFNRAGWPEWVPVDTIRLQGKKGAPSRYSLVGIKNSGDDSLQNPLQFPLQNVLQKPLQEPLPIYKTKTKTKEKTPSESKRKRFVPPTVDEVRAYCLERRNGIDPQAFVDFYEARGWKYGQGKPVVDWKACVRTWENRRKQEGTEHERLVTLADIPGR